MNRRLALTAPTLAAWLALTGVALGQPTAARAQPHAALAPAPVRAAECPGAELEPQSANLALVRSATLCLVDQERALHGESPLRLNDKLASAAERHTREMVTEGYFDHVAPDGQTPLERITATGYISGTAHGFVIGENIAWGTYRDATPLAIVRSWIASPPHLANILDGRFRDTAIGVLPAVPGRHEPGATYTQDFGLVLD
jgi:uncharacterized protein YkwD